MVPSKQALKLQEKEVIKLNTKLRTDGNEIKEDGSLLSSNKANVSPQTKLSTNQQEEKCQLINNTLSQFCFFSDRKLMSCRSEINRFI